MRWIGWVEMGFGLDGLVRVNRIRPLTTTLDPCLCYTTIDRTRAAGRPSVGLVAYAGSIIG